MRRHLPAGTPAYLETRGHVVTATAADPKQQFMIRTRKRAAIETVRAELQSHDIEVAEGSWFNENEGDAAANELNLPWIAAVAYKSGDDKPGTWVDAFNVEPSQMQVLRRIYGEFQQTGEIGDTEFEDFLRLASPNVVIVSPGRLAGFLAEESNGLHE